MTKKNRKARRLRELYPGTNVKILYQRDYYNLLVKYGLEEPRHGVLADDTEPRLLDLTPDPVDQ